MSKRLTAKPLIFLREKQHACTSSIYGWQLTGLCLGLLISLCVNQEVVADSNSAGIEKLSIVNNKVSLQVENVSLQEVLQALTDKANIQLLVDGELTNKINIAQYNQPTEQLLRQLLGHRNFIIIYADNHQSINKIYVYGVSESASETFAFQMEPSAKEISAELEWVYYLFTLPEDEAIEGLAGILSTKEKHLETKLYAIELLSALSHNKDSVYAMAQGLADDRTELRSQLISTLGQLEHQVAQQILGQVIFGEKDPELRLQAVKQFANIDTPVSKAFITAATKDVNDDVQTEALLILESYQQ